MAARCACAPILAPSSLAALESTRDSSSASRSVEAIGDTGSPSPSAAPACMSFAIGAAINLPTPKARRRESDSSAAPDQKNSVHAWRSWPSTSDSGAHVATRQPVRLDQ